MICFALFGPALAGPNRDEGQMLWIMWVYLDFPLGFIAMFVSDFVGRATDSNFLAVAVTLLIGGIQWAFWGWLLQLAFSFVARLFTGARHVDAS